MIVEPAEVLEHWFGGHDPDDPATGRQQAGLWWGQAEHTDRELAERFGATHEAACRGELRAWASDPSGRVALVLVLDQLSRNLHRGTPRAFANDETALRSTLEAIARGEDRTRPFFHRVFLYMPFQHSERLAMQEQGGRMFERLRDEANDAQRELARMYLGFMWRHRDIVARFGRFPHRNAILGRPSSGEELRFLTQPGSSF
ncbi:DUF924 family protein [Paraliomyxa miuraensis]|uniref:DUF924 family protein n=1 Tax=Paraliomyxa miuraensis TaxID=376150 RepID=UPI00225A42E7|nr:DUF924 family protein [Paraliomyxa miuraensis]MCX4243532.1 DUF924 domain-containing protein [Paraliomyxa miuraensis]